MSYPMTLPSRAPLTNVRRPFAIISEWVEKVEQQKTDAETIKKIEEIPKAYVSVNSLLAGNLKNRLIVCLSPLCIKDFRAIIISMNRKLRSLNQMNVSTFEARQLILSITSPLKFLFEALNASLAGKGLNKEFEDEEPDYSALKNQLENYDLRNLIHR